jgi:hypothetical protein
MQARRHVGGSRKSVFSIPAAIAGAAIAIVAAGLLLLHEITDWIGQNPVLGAAVGVVLGFVLGGLLPLTKYALSTWLSPLGVESIDVKIPGLGPLSVRLGDVQRTVGRRILVELVTRVSTQRIAADGTLRVALDSLKQLMAIVRDELKEMPPTPPPLPGQGQATVELVVMRLLNDAIRPYVTRWDGRLADWEATAMPEYRWPLEHACRTDLERMRSYVLAYAATLADMLRIPKWEDVLAEPEQQPDGRLRTAPTDEVLKQIEEFDTHLSPKISPQQAAAGWRLYVELVSRIAVQELVDDAGLLREALTSLYRLYRQTRGDLKRMAPTPRTVDTLPNVETLALTILNEDIRPFLGKWHAQLTAWEQENQSEQAWPEASACRRELQECQEKVRKHLDELGKLIGVKL